MNTYENMPDYNAATGVLSIPARRYAMFSGLGGRRYMIVVVGEDIERAPKWGDFLCWVGGIKQAATRQVKKPKMPRSERR